MSGLEASGADSSDVAIHTATNTIRRHHGALDQNGEFVRADEVLETGDEPDHDELCRREQEWFLDAIGGTVDVASHLDAVVESLRIVLAADESIRTGRVVDLAGD